MKHRTAAALALLLMLSLLVFPSCKEESDPKEAILGTWKITECIVGGEPLVDMNDCFFTFEADGSGEKVIAEELQFTYQYTFDGVTCILFNITYADGSLDAGTYAEMTVKGNTMTVTAEENGSREEVTLMRQK